MWKKFKTKNSMFLNYTSLKKERVRIGVRGGGEVTRSSKRKIFVVLSNLNFLLFLMSLLLLNSPFNLHNLILKNLTVIRMVLFYAATFQFCAF